MTRSEPDLPSLDDLPKKVVLKLDELCDCYEYGLRTGKGPTIRDLLGDRSGPERSVLLYLLLQADLEHALEDGRRPALEDGLASFPTDARIVLAVYRELGLAAPAAVAAPDASPPPEIPRYQLLTRLGEGGMGTVYKALHTQLGRFDAIKVLKPRPGVDLESEVDFSREIRTLGNLAHRHIIHARDCGRAGDKLYLVMEYLEGLDLRALVERLGPLPIGDACELARRVAAALKYAETHHIVHRDIKPQNILFGWDGGIAEVKVADFGLAKLRGAEHFEGRIVGSFAYMAPEQYWERRSDARSDIYSLGCTLYYLIAGRPPFGERGWSVDQLMRAHRDDAPPPLRALRPELAPELDALVQTLLAKRSRERPSSAADVVEALAPFVAGAELDALLHRGEQEPRAPEARPQPPVPAPEPHKVGLGRDAPAVGHPQDSPDESSPGWERAISGTTTADLPRRSAPVSVPGPPVPESNLPHAPPIAKRGSSPAPRTVTPPPLAPQPTAAARSADGGGASRGLRWLYGLGAALVLAVVGLIATRPGGGRGATPIDLLAAVDPQRDSLRGEWRRERAQLVSPDAPFAQLELPANLPAEYRLEIEVSRVSGGELMIGLVRDGRSLPVVLLPSVAARGTGVDDESARALAARLGFAGGAPNTYTCIVTRQGTVVAFEDRIAWAGGPGDRPSSADQSEFVATARLSLGAHHSVYRFSRITLVPTGH